MKIRILKMTVQIWGTVLHTSGWNLAMASKSPVSATTLVNPFSCSKADISNKTNFKNLVNQNSKISHQLSYCQWFSTKYCSSKVLEQSKGACRWLWDEVLGSTPTPETDGRTDYYSTAEGGSSPLFHGTLLLYTGGFQKCRFIDGLKMNIEILISLICVFN